VHTVQIGATLSLSGALVQVGGCWLAPTSVLPLFVGQALYNLGHGIHQPCGQAGAVSDLPHQAGRAVSWSGFGMMLVAFCVGQLAAPFVDAAYSHGAWPMTVPLLGAAVVLVAIAFGWLPRLYPQTRKETTP
jgi:DHA1 family bicyclomycin/chloramphenicol resistance-like MFS transporter